MSIERLHIAAAAAGFAMAAMDDDTDDALPADHRSVPAPSAASYGIKAVGTLGVRTVTVREAIAPGSHWLKGFLPSLGGRAPA